MTKPITALLLASFVLASCGTRLNPFNWFGNSREVQVVEAGPTNPLLPQQRQGVFSRPEVEYPGVPIDTITQLNVERVPSGAIVRATGIAARQGVFDVRLTPLTDDGPDENGVMAYSFDVVYPVTPTPIRSENSRLVNVAVSLSNEELEEIGVIRVQSRSNARETRRR